MRDKKIIGLVLGRLNPDYYLANFEELLDKYEIFVFCIAPLGIQNRRWSNFNFKLYPDIEDMPGYIKSLEDELKSVDFIVAINTAQISSFQASRAAEKHHKYFMVYNTEWQTGLFDQFRNVKAIQYSVTQQAQLIVVPSLGLKDHLLMEGVEEGKILVMQNRLNRDLISRRDTKRNKFRKYLNLKESDFVLLMQFEVRPEFKVLEFFYGIKKFCHTNHIKILILCKAEESQELKYKAFEIGLGSNVMFLHQSISPFMEDLYSSCDLSIHPNYQNTKEQLELPVTVFPQIECGVMQLALEGSLVTDLLPHLPLVMNNWNRFEIERTLQKILENKDFIMKNVELINQYIAKQPVHPLIQVFDEIAINNETEIQVEKVLLAAEEKLREGDLKSCAELLEGIEDAEISNLNLSEAYRIKGELYYLKGKFDQSLQHYQKSLRLNANSSQAYCGLGFLSWQSHSNDEALTFFKKCLSLDTQNGQAMLGIGLVNKRVGLARAALHWFEKSLMIDDRLLAMASFTQTCDEYPDVEFIIPILKRLIELLGEVQPLMLALGSAYLKTGRINEGKAILNQAFAVGA